MTKLKEFLMTDLTDDQDAVRRYLCDLAPDARLMTVHLGKTKNEMLDHQSNANGCPNFV